MNREKFSIWRIFIHDYDDYDFFIQKSDVFTFRRHTNAKKNEFSEKVENELNKEKFFSFSDLKDDHSTIHPLLLCKPFSSLDLSVISFSSHICTMCIIYIMHLYISMRFSSYFAFFHLIVSLILRSKLNWTVHSSNKYYQCNHAEKRANRNLIRVIP